MQCACIGLAIQGWSPFLYSLNLGGTRALLDQWSAAIEIILYYFQV